LESQLDQDGVPEGGESRLGHWAHPTST
jgi:hypothetical protein